MSMLACLCQNGNAGKSAQTVHTVRQAAAVGALYVSSAAIQIVVQCDALFAFTSMLQ